MLKAKDIMTAQVITVYPDTEITKAAALLIEKHINGLPVVDREGILQGIICQSDLMVNNNIHTLPVLKNGFLAGVIGKEDIIRTLIPASGK